MAMKSSAYRRLAREAGIYAAQGGPDRRREFDSKGLVHAYDQGYEQEIADQNRNRAYEEEREVLNRIHSQADALATRSDNEEVREIADMLRDLTEHLLTEKNNG